MTAVDPASQLAALIRVQVAALRRREAPPGQATAKRINAPPADAGAATPDLSSVVADRIRSIDRSDPQRERKAFRFFLETVILSELGQALVNDPSFPLMLDHVQQQMEGDPDLAQAASDAARVLLAVADGDTPG